MRGITNIAVRLDWIYNEALLGHFLKKFNLLDLKR